MTDTHRGVATALLAGPKRAVWLGALALRHPQYADLRGLAGAIAQLAGATFAELAEGGNAAGAYLAGCVPHREAGGKVLAQIGRNTAEMLASPLSAYILFGGVEPEADTLSPEALQALLGRAQLVIAITPYMTEQLKQVAHVILPIGTFAETSGTYVNLEGLWQSFTAAARGFGESRPGWKVLRVLGTQLGLEQFEYQSSEEVRRRAADHLCRGPAARLGRFAVMVSGSSASRGQYGGCADVSGRCRRAARGVTAAHRRGAQCARDLLKPQGATVFNTLTNYWDSLPAIVRSTTISTLWILAVCIVTLIICVAFTTLCRNAR